MMKTTIVMLTTALAVLTAGLMWAQQTANPNPILWEVNGEPIYASEVSMMMQQLVAQAKAQGQQPDQAQLVEASTQRMIEQKLLAQEARRYGVKNNEERVAQLTNMMVQQAGGREKLDPVLASGGTSFEQTVASIREMDLVMNFVDSQLAPTIKVSDEEVKAYYQENLSLFTTDDQVHARHIIFAAAEDADDATKAAARGKAVKARERALAGEDFQALARELSEGPSAERGGDLGFFSRSQMVPSFADTAFALKAGEISEVVQTTYGFHVIMVVQTRPAGTRTLEEMNFRIQTALRQQKVGETVGGLLETLRSNSEIKATGPVSATAPAPDGADTFPGALPQ